MSKKYLQRLSIRSHIITGVAASLAVILVYVAISSYMTNKNVVESDAVSDSNFATIEVEGADQTAGPRKKRPLAAVASTSTTTSPVVVTPSIPPPSPTLKTMAWIYPGNPACSASTEITDGRNIHTLKAEYYTINGGSLRQITSAEYCNGYSPSNVATLKQHSVEQYVTISSGNAGDMTTFLSNEANRQRDVATLVNFVVSNDMTGVELDFEDFGGWDATSYGLFKTFVTELGNGLRTQGKKLMIDGPAVANTSEQNWYVWRYADFVTLPVDYMVVMTYDYQFDHGSGQPVAPLDWMRSVMTFVSAQYPKSKLVMGIPSYGYQGTIGTYRSTILTHEQAKKKTGYNTATRDGRSGEMMWRSGTTHFVFQDSQSLNAKANIATELGIPAVSVWHLGGNRWFTK